jgi:hypothetical protein
MNPSVAVDWLLKTRRGREALKETLLFLPKDLETEYLERYRPAYVLIKCYRDGAVEVFGERFVRPYVAFLGRQDTFADAEAVRDERLHKTLPERFREIDYPGFKVGAADRNDFKTPVPLWLAGSGDNAGQWSDVSSERAEKAIITA